MRFPLPELYKNQFTIGRYPLPDAPARSRKYEHYIDNGICHGCDKKKVYTCKVAELPNLCQPCYEWMRKYSKMDDPYHIERIREGTVVDDQLVKKAISYAKVKTMDVAGVTSMSTGAILFHAYKDIFKEVLHEAAVRAEEENRSADVNRQEEIRNQEELEEEARIQERKQELARKICENKRITAAQQARRNRLAGKNKAKYNDDNTEFKNQEIRVKVK